MRKIEFRAWLKDKKRMVDVKAIDWDKDGNIFSVNYPKGKSYCGFGVEDIELMQYTGLKDANDVKIFEGDILKYPDNDDTYCMGVVEFGHFNCSCCHAVFGFTTVNNEGYEIDMLLANNFKPLYEVVGNIYENKELLEGEEK